MPLHLVLIMTAALSFMLWLAFDGDEAELREPQPDTDAHVPSDPFRAHKKVELRLLAAQDGHALSDSDAHAR
jgi:hypothetical protein